MSSLDSPQRTPERIDQLLFGALAGLSVAAVFQLTDKNPRIDKFLEAALLCFSIALPVLVSSFLLEVAGTGKDKKTPRRIFDLSGVLISLAGFVLLFFHIDLLAGIIFLVSVFVCLFVVILSLR